MESARGKAESPDGVKPTAAMIDRALAPSFLGAVRFDPPLEAIFDQRTAAERIVQIRVAGSAAIALGNLYCLADMIIVADVWRLAVVLSTFMMTPGFSLFLYLMPRLTPRIRETILGVSLIVSLFVPLTLFVQSAHPFAAYITGTVSQILVCGNITFRMRFAWACRFTAIALLASTWAIVVHEDLSIGLGAALLFQIMISGAFSLIANHQMEKSMRRSFLLALREALRSDQLALDKEVLSTLSLVDSLTGRANRRAFDAHLARLWARHEREQTNFAVLMIDVDFFKSYNDRHGHLAGDACLVAVASVLAATSNPEKDLVARYGGEEFAVLMNDAGVEAAAALAARVRSAFAIEALPHLGRDDGVSVVTVSIGGAASRTNTLATTAESVVAAADGALYAAKKAGRDRAEIAWPVHERAMRLSA